MTVIEKLKRVILPYHILGHSISYLMLILLGSSLLCNGFFADKKKYYDSIFYAFFMSVATRNASFYTMNVNDF